ncbi:putative inactive 1-aminocyclopropane-1-carboxylate synthase-like protein 2 [Ceratocystis fimbriata CBS 114723]|uniref:Putative inactive 1-aminocyclopropane-1-carboxylate synthase-like protein 2 n=1 Tax=Ceratocystis fimbriata CBS 114723 TaxID=1035309 RepID=A0A2C5WWR8_9PEZI|nr:putative inactive 1-aminocyclopropane-1-carboxylate synthase-like protein 2 [Ceratocystis fimbriata CBS 114723]
MSLSKRAEPIARQTPLTKIWEVIANVWHPETNPSGFVSLGVAENSLMHDALCEKLPAASDISTIAFTYGNGLSGSLRLRTALASFLNDKHSPATPILPAHIMLTNGCSAAIEQLSWILADPGDVWLLGQPYYGTFIPDLGLRPDAEVMPVSFGDVDPLSIDAAQAYEAAIIKAQSQGKRVAALMLCNPHNPLGRCYTRETIVALMKLCQKYQIHLVTDELYALSIWKNTVDLDVTPAEFVSCLSIPTEGLIDPKLVHVLWGMSKDFGANGIRIGMIIDQHNEALRQAIFSTCIYSSISSLPDIMTAKIFEDRAWVESYVAENNRQLSDRFAIVAHWAKDNGIEYAKGNNAGFFVWVNLGDIYLRHHPNTIKSPTINDEITEALLENRVFLASGSNFGSEKPGWYRIVFAVDKMNLVEGLDRVLKTLKGQVVA